ncbi:hypothetical protein QBC38DRAFT_183778, partial [Podospora fimiseda]
LRGVICQTLLQSYLDSIPYNLPQNRNFKSSLSSSPKQIIIMSPRISPTSEDFQALLSYIEKDATPDFFLLIITVFHKHATEFLAPLHRTAIKPPKPDPREIETRMSLPASHPNNAWIHDKTQRSWGQSEHATVYLMRMIKGDLDGEKNWRGEQDVWPRWSRTFWGSFSRLQDLYMGEWMWPKGDQEARRVFRDAGGERRMRRVLVGLFEEIERYGTLH